MTPEMPNARVREAFDHHQAGRLAQAHHLYREALAEDPGDAHANHLMGVLMHQGGHQVAAETLLRKATEICPRWPDPWVNLGRVLRAMGRADEAESALRHALSLDDSLYTAWNNLGALLMDRQAWKEALATLQNALAIEPDDADAWFNQGVVFCRTGEFEPARSALQRCLQLQPDHAAAYGQLAEVALAQGDAGAAAELARSGLRFEPGHAELLYTLGFALTASGELAAAIEAYQGALVADPENGAALSALVFTKRQLLDWSGLERLLQRMGSMLERGQAGLTPFALLAEDSSRQQQLACARLACEAVLGGLAPEHRPPPTRRDPHAGAVITVGYLSADYYRHPTAYLAAGLFEAHDRSRFRVIGYSNSRDDGSAIRQRLENAFDEFVDIRALSVAAAARRIAADGVDILVDLKGHTLEAATAVMALRPAPIQVQYLGYPGSMGAAFIDYLIGDRWVTPRAHRADYDEHLVRLPGSYQVNDALRPAPPSRDTRAGLGLPARALVLCCFNAPWKLNARQFDTWARILTAVPDSVLWLLGRDSLPELAANLRSEMTLRGIDAERLVLARKRPLDGYLALYHHADLFLDSSPYGAHTTASDALWMGCPVITLPGETFASRVGASLLSAVGLEELIARDTTHYVQLAVTLAQDDARRNRLRQQLLHSRTSAPLFDTRGTTRHIEAAYQEMLRRHRAGNAGSFDVRPGAPNV